MLYYLFLHELMEVYPTLNHLSNECELNLKMKRHLVQNQLIDL